MRFAHLFHVDREEAINNLDRAFEAKLNAFHSLYDVSRSLFAYFDHGDTALLIAVRNALHHHDNPLFHSYLARLHLEGGSSRWSGASFLMCGYPTRHGSPLVMSHPVCLEDLYARLDPARSSPYLDTHLTGQKARDRLSLIERDLALGVIRDRAIADRYPDDQVYVDLMPVFVSAACRVFKAMKAAGVRFRGDDAQTYVMPFTSEIDVDLRTPNYSVHVLR